MILYFLVTFSLIFLPCDFLKKNLKKIIFGEELKVSLILWYIHVQYSKKKLNII